MPIFSNFHFKTSIFWRLLSSKSKVDEFLSYKWEEEEEGRQRIAYVHQYYWGFTQYGQELIRGHNSIFTSQCRSAVLKISHYSRYTTKQDVLLKIEAAAKNECKYQYFTLFLLSFGFFLEFNNVGKIIENRRYNTYKFYCWFLARKIQILWRSLCSQCCKMRLFAWVSNTAHYSKYLLNGKS